MIVQPETFLRWHRQAFCLFWRWKSRKKGRPPLPKNLQELIRKMARENPVWGEEQIANELLLKLGIRVSSRTVRKYLESGRPRGSSGHRWRIFVRNHARAMVACDFFVSVTATFRIVYVFAALEISPVESCTATPRSILPPHGRSSSSVSSWRSIIPTGS